MTRIEFHGFSFELEVMSLYAPRIDTLADKCIGFVSNKQRQAVRMLLLCKFLKADYPKPEPQYRRAPVLTRRK